MKLNSKIASVLAAVSVLVASCGAVEPVLAAAPTQQQQICYNSAKLASKIQEILLQNEDALEEIASEVQSDQELNNAERTFLLQLLFFVNIKKNLEPTELQQVVFNTCISSSKETI